MTTLLSSSRLFNQLKASLEMIPFDNTAVSDDFAWASGVLECYAVFDDNGLLSQTFHALANAFRVSQLHKNNIDDLLDEALDAAIGHAALLLHEMIEAQG